MSETVRASAAASSLKFARFAAGIAVAVGLLVLLGWALDLVVLTSVLPGLPSMKANTAVAFIFCGLALASRTATSRATASTPADVQAERMRLRIGHACAAFVVLIAVVTLIEYALSWDLGIDQLLFREVATYVGRAGPGRMSLSTALSFTLIGSSLLLLDVETRRGFRPSEILARAATLIGFIALMGYLYGVKSLQGIGPFASMALHSALTSVLLCIGILSARPYFGMMKEFLSDSAGGVMARRLLPAALLVPPFLGWLRTVGQEAGLYDTAFGRALLVSSMVLVFTAIIWRNVAVLNRVDKDRARAYAEASKNQQFLQAIVDNSPAIIAVKDLEGRYLLVNRRFAEAVGRSEESVLGKTDQHLMPRSAADTVREVDQRVVNSGSTIVQERTTADFGVPRTYLTAKTPLRDNGGTIYALVAIATDITDRKQHELERAALLEREQLNAARMVRQLSQLNLLDQITRAIRERHDLQSIFQIVVRTLEDRLPIDFGCICLYEEAKQSLVVARVGTKSESLVNVLAMSEQSRIAIDENGLATALRGQLVYEPSVAGSKFPFPQRLARAGLQAMVIAPLLVEKKVIGILVAARQEPESFSSGDCEFLRQLSEHVGLAAHQSQLYGSLQKAYDDLQQSQQAAVQQERLRALGQMASGIAHDINNALSPAALYVQSLLEREANLSERAREGLSTIHRAIEDVSETVARMREFYRSRETQLALAPVDSNQLIKQVVDLTRARWNDMPQERGIVIDLKTDLAVGLPAFMGAESEVRDSLTNLLFNAIDAIPEGGTVTMRTRIARSPGDESTRSVVIEVCDSGVGMDEDTKRRCLEPFFTTKGERGTGLGLAMVYGMVQRHSAELQIETAPGQGTIMRLLFPIAAEKIAAPPMPVATAPTMAKLKILLVDDDPLIIASLATILQGDGHAIATADGGQAGIDTFLAALSRGEHFDVVITDLGMPYVDGRRVAAAVHGASQKTRIVLLTGWGQRLVAENDVPTHVDRVLSKPPKLRELRAVLAELSVHG